VTVTIEEQLRAFAARNVGDDLVAGHRDGTLLPGYVGEHRPSSRGRGVLVGVAMLAVLVLAVVLVAWRTGEDRSHVVVDDQVPGPAPDPALVIATRAVVGSAALGFGPQFTDPPAHARVVVTTAAQAGGELVGMGCGSSIGEGDGDARDVRREWVEPATPVTVFQIEWDQPVTLSWRGAPPAGQVVRWRSATVGTPPYVKGSVACAGAGVGLIPDDVALETLGTPLDVALDEPAAITASSVAMSAASLIDRLPITADVVVTTPDRLAGLGLHWASDRCTATDVVVVQLDYGIVEQSYLGEGPDGPVDVPIGSSLTARALPEDEATLTACGGSSRYLEEPIDLSTVGTPVHVDLTR
jgi:hypothetical protein